MKITSSAVPRPASVANANAAAGSGRTSAGGASNAAGGVATATPADPAARLSQLEAQFSQSDFDVAKVNEITAAIASGQYTVNADAIADGLINGSLAVGDAGNG